MCHLQGDNGDAGLSACCTLTSFHHNAKAVCVTIHGMDRALDIRRGDLAPCTEETETMSDRSGDRDRVEGSVDEIKGEAKQTWGDLTGDDRMKAEGMADE